SKQKPGVAKRFFDGVVIYHDVHKAIACHQIKNNDDRYNDQIDNNRVEQMKGCCARECEVDKWQNNETEYNEVEQAVDQIDAKELPELIKPFAECDEECHAFFLLDLM